MDKELSNIFNDTGHRLTQPRMAVFNFIKSSDLPLSIADIVRLNPAMDKVSIYRTISLFKKLHIVVAVNNGWKQLYELASPFNPHHHHLVCTKCGKLTEIHSKKLESMVEELTSENDFHPVSHHFEINGLCSNCLTLVPDLPSQP